MPPDAEPPNLDAPDAVADAGPEAVPQPLGAEPDAILPYRVAEGDDGAQELVAEVFRPDTPAQGTVLYLHPGGFHTGSPTLGRRFAREVTQRGFAFVAPQYRLVEDRGHLGFPFAGQSKRLRAEVPEAYDLPWRFKARHAHAATEDALAALAWVAADGPGTGAPAQRLTVFGVSAGGILAMNLAFLAPAMKVARPPISAMAVLSGALPNLARCDMTKGPALYCAHARLDDKVSVQSTLDVAKACSGRAAPTEFQVFDGPGHGSWLYRSPILPGRNQRKRRAQIWEFLIRNADYCED